MRYKTLIPEAKQGLLKNMSMIANMRYAYQSSFQDGTFTGSRFVNQQWRLEILTEMEKRILFREVSTDQISAGLRDCFRGLCVG
jgi:hypothetical protein